MTDLIAQHGGYQNLKSFQGAEIIFDLTFEFVQRFVKSLKWKEQMEGAARGGKQNIAEGSKTSGTSKQSELRLVDVARASLEELLNDYKDFLRVNNLLIWDKNDKRILAIRKLAYAPNRSCKSYMTYMSNSESFANCLICLIHQTNYLLDQQLRVLEKDLALKGDFKDRQRAIKKSAMLNDGPSFEEFIKSFGLKRLENGQVVKINDEDKIGPI